RTGRGPTSVKALNAVLAQERRAGCAIEHGEVTPGISTIAAPVYDVLKRPIAAIGVSLISEALPEDMTPVVDRVQTAAGEVTVKLRGGSVVEIAPSAEGSSDLFDADLSAGCRNHKLIGFVVGRFKKDPIELVEDNEAQPPEA